MVAKRRKAFTLIELLSVIALIALLVVASGSAINGLSDSGRSTKSLLNISEALEWAREYAVSHNTYTWVAFSNHDGLLDKPLVMAIFASTDGSRAGVALGGSGSTSVDASGGALRLMHRMEKLEDCVLSAEIPPGNALSSSLPAGSSDPSFATASKFTCTARIDEQARTLNFDRAVMFTPNGEAKVSPSLPEFVQITVIPTKGNRTSRVLRNEAASVIRISGLTGRVAVYRP